MKKFGRLLSEVSFALFLAALALGIVFVFGLILRLLVWVFMAGFQLPGDAP